MRERFGSGRREAQIGDQHQNKRRDDAERDDRVHDRKRPAQQGGGDSGETIDYHCRSEAGDGCDVTAAVGGFEIGVATGAIHAVRTRYK